MRVTVAVGIREGMGVELAGTGINVPGAAQALRVRTRKMLKQARVRDRGLQFIYRIIPI